MNESANWLQVAHFQNKKGLAYLRQELESRGIEHRILVVGDGLLLEIRDNQKAAEVQALIKNLQRFANGGPGSLILPGNPLNYPVVLACILLSCLGALLFSYKFEWVHWFSFQNFIDLFNQRDWIPLDQALQSGEYWRLITPIFIHFGPIHLLFNSLWLWEFGRRIERLSGSLHLISVVLVTGLFSNFFQYFFGAEALFGGMSGVVYGLLGYIWMRNRLAPQLLLNLVPGLFTVMIIFLFICMTGLVDLLIPGQVANAAHVGGLLSGMLLGFVLGNLDRQKAKPVV